MKLIQAKENDFVKVKEAYLDILANTPDILAYSKWEYGLHPSDEELTRYIREGSMYIFVNEEEIVGVSACVSSQPEEYHPVDWQIEAADDEVMSLHLLAVRPKFAGTGAAQEMIRSILQLAAEKGLKACRLDTLETNVRARKFYPKCGLSFRGVYKWYSENSGWDDFYLYEAVL